MLQLSQVPRSHLGSSKHSELPLVNHVQMKLTRPCLCENDGTLLLLHGALEYWLLRMSFSFLWLSLFPLLTTSLQHNDILDICESDIRTYTTSIRVKKNRPELLNSTIGSIRLLR